MGLDMHLSAKKSLYVWDKESDLAVKANTINELFGLETDEDLHVKEVSFIVAYWRKSNQIHNWFVENVQDGEDDCGEYYVARESLETLLSICREVLADNSKADELLPTQGGFFFGGTDYDEWYFQGVEYTVTRLERILKDPVFNKMEFYYHASW